MANQNNFVVKNGLSVSGSAYASTFVSNATTGTAPFTVASTTPVANLSIGGNAATATSATTATNVAGGSTGAVNYQSAASTTAFLAGNTTTTPQFVTSTGTGSVAQAPTLTSSTGSGSVVLATSPTLVTPALGIPSSATLTNATGLPISTGVSGLGTGVATALAVNTGSTGAFVLYNGALGTPSSGTVTNLTGTASININGTVGATTASTGAFTTLSASSTVSGTGFSTYLASPPAIGGTAAAAITGTTITATTFSGAGTNLTGTASGLSIGGNAATATTATNQSGGTVNATSITNSGLTSGRVVYTTTGGLETSSANMTFDGSTLTTLNTAYTGTLTGGTGVVNIGSGQIYKDASGNVGIGTSSPTQKLDVYAATGNTTMQMRVGNSAQASVKAVNNRDYIQLAVDYATVYVDGGVSSPMAFLAGNAERMRIDSSGNVGIGTSSPANKLSVYAGGIVANFGAYGTGAYDDIELNAYSGSCAIGTRGSTPLLFNIARSEKMRLDTSGNLGLGVTPSAWESGAKVIQMSTSGVSGTSGSSAAFWARGDSLRIGNGFYFNGGNYIYTATGVAPTVFTQNGVVNGGFAWQYAASGTAGGTFTFSEAMRITSAGNVGIGNSSPPQLLTVGSSSTRGIQQIIGTSGGNPLLLIDNTNIASGKQWGITSGASNAANLDFADYSVGGIKLSINAGGNLMLAGATATANGTGITFPATQSASSDANCLDDYEEGTWTPAYSFGGGTTGVTYATQAGSYIKIGRLVTVWCYIVLSNKGSSTGAAQITGMPFTQSMTVAYGGGCAQFFSNFTALGYGIIGDGSNGSSAINLYTGGITTSGQMQQVTNFSNNSVIEFVYSYLSA